MAKATTSKSAIVPVRTDPMEACADAALKLAAESPWADISLRDIAQAAGVSFAELYARAPGKARLLDHLSRRFDLSSLSAVESADDVSDRLFEVMMARLEIMEPHRFVLIAIARSEGPSPRMLRRLTLTARAILEASGVDASGRRGAVRVAGMTAVWSRVVQVWRDDEGALNRTMAEIDKRLKQMRARLNQIGAGF